MYTVLRSLAVSGLSKQTSPLVASSTGEEEDSPVSMDTRLSTTVGCQRKGEVQNDDGEACTPLFPCTTLLCSSSAKMPDSCPLLLPNCPLFPLLLITTHSFRPYRKFMNIACDPASAGIAQHFLKSRSLEVKVSFSPLPGAVLSYSNSSDY